MEVYKNRMIFLTRRPKILKSQSMKDRSNLITWNRTKGGKYYKHKMAQKADENSKQLAINLADKLYISITSYDIEAVTDY